MSQQSWARFFDSETCCFKPSPGMIFKSKQALEARGGLFKNSPVKMIKMEGEFFGLFQRLLRNLKVESKPSSDPDAVLRIQTSRESIIDGLMTNMIHASEPHLKKAKGRSIYQTGYFAEGSAITLTYYDFPIPHIAKMRGGMVQIEINHTQTGEVLYQRRIFILSYEEEDVGLEAREHYRTCASRDRINALGTGSIEEAVTNYILEITPYQPFRKAS